MDIKTLVESNEYMIVLDTNVLLNIYRYSPDFSDFALNCICAVQEHVVLPATVRLEYGKHCRAEFSKMVGRVENAQDTTKDQIRRAKEKVLATCDGLERLQFPDIGELRTLLASRLDEVQAVLEDFFEERSNLEFVSHAWNNTDHVQALVSSWDQNGSIMQAPSQEDIYSWCEEGETRYKKEVPPGFKDAKNKDGVRKYSDLILWKEILRFAAREKKNIIFVTDDVKADWWETDNRNRKFHEKLVAEFSKTGQQIEPFVSHDFYNEIATVYGIEKTDVVELALRMTDEDYCNKIADKVFDRVIDSLVYSGTDYIDDSTAHIGSEGIDELEITNYDFVSAERIDRNDDIVTYQFTYQVTAEGTSYEYWGRDEDTREVIRSNGTDHVFEGLLTIEVQRATDIYLDFESDNSFDEVEIISSDLKETAFHENWEIDEPEPGELGFCPDCGCPLNIENDAGGFCYKCMMHHE